MKKIHQPDELWPWLDQLGDKQSHYLLEQFIPGSVFHVDSVVSEREVVFADAHAYGSPPLDVSHQGGVFTTRTLPRNVSDVQSLFKINRHVIEGLGSVRGVTHAEFLRAHRMARSTFSKLPLVWAARTSRMSSKLHRASIYGVNGRAWKWARASSRISCLPFEMSMPASFCALRDRSGRTPVAYTDPEIIYRIAKYHHAGLIVKSPEAGRVDSLLNSYATRFAADFLATQPVPDKPTA